MNKKTSIKTVQQKEFCSSIIKKKIRGYKKSDLLNPVSDMQYMNNCMYWINEYETNGADLSKAKDAALHLIKYCEKYIKK